MKLACKLQHHIFLRSGETISKKQYLTLKPKKTYIVHGAKWAEIDFDNKIWNVPAIRMKMGLEHTVPLSTQALKLLNELHEETGYSPFIFPNPQDKSKPMDRDRLSATLKQYKIPYTAHSDVIVRVLKCRY